MFSYAILKAAIRNIQHSNNTIILVAIRFPPPPSASCSNLEPLSSALNIYDEYQDL